MLRTWRRFLIGLVVLVILAGNGLILFCWRHNVWSRDEWMIYKELDRGSDPSWREYHFARIRAGDPVDEVLARTEPVTVVQQGPVDVPQIQEDRRGRLRRPNGIRWRHELLLGTDLLR